MKWKGMVSHLSHRIIAAMFASANAPQAISTFLRRSKPVPRVAHGLDRCALAELLAHPPDTDLGDVRAGIEVVAPDLGEQPLAADHLAGVEHQVVQQPEL